VQAIPGPGDNRRDTISLLAAAEDRIAGSSLVSSMRDRGQYTRLMHSALSGSVVAVRLHLQSVDRRTAEHLLRDRHHVLDDETVADWPLLALVLQLGLTDVARVLIENSEV